MKDLAGGLSASLEHIVTAGDLASAWRNEFPVLSTPILLWLSELACMRAVEHCLAPEEITLGVLHNSRHIAASLEGAQITILATLINWSDKSLEFSVRAYDQSRLVLDGAHSRAVLTRQRFNHKLRLLQSADESH